MDSPDPNIQIWAASVSIGLQPTSRRTKDLCGCRHLVDYSLWSVQA
jgi:hypothetical protein